MQTVFSTILLSTLATLGISMDPPKTLDQDWQSASGWTEVNGLETYTAQSTSIIAACERAPDEYLHLPFIVAASQVLKIDGREIARSQFDLDLHAVRSTMGQPSVSCKDLVGGHVAEWSARLNSKYFAHFGTYPYLSKFRLNQGSLTDISCLIAVGASLFLGIFIAIVFWGRVSNRILISLVCSCIGTFLFALGETPGLLGLTISMITAVRITIFGVWFAVLSLLAAYFFEGLMSRRLFLTFAAFVPLAMIFILAGSSIDTIQFGSVQLFPISLIMCLTFQWKIFKLAGHSRRPFLKKTLYFLAPSSFLLGGVNEMFAALGKIHTPLVLPFYVVIGILFFALYLNEKIRDIYIERDYLRENLEREVVGKTLELSNALISLKSAQADLLRKEKLASLGVMAAGVAHEVNNPLNFIKGYAQLVKNEVLNGTANKEKTTLLIDKISETVVRIAKITDGLVKYSRNIDDGGYHEVCNLRTILERSLKLIGPLLSTLNITLECEVLEDMWMMGSETNLEESFAQVFGNAIECVCENDSRHEKIISIHFAKSDGAVSIKVSDSGHAIPTSIGEKVFDPFFTTKPVGSGTGLGLSTVRSIVQNHGGNIEAEFGVSPKAFTLTFPLFMEIRSEESEDPILKGH